MIDGGVRRSAAWELWATVAVYLVAAVATVITYTRLPAGGTYNFDGTGVLQPLRVRGDERLNFDGITRFHAQNWRGLGIVISNRNSFRRGLQRVGRLGMARLCAGQIRNR